MVPVSIPVDLLVGFSRAGQTIVAGSVAFALSYVIVRFALVGLVGWATAGEDGTVAGRFGPSVAKLLAFCNALTATAGVAAIDLPLVWTYGASVVFVLGVAVYRFERVLEGRRAST
jgi:hypothetical protein